MNIKHKEGKIFGIIMAFNLAGRELWSTPHLTTIIILKSVLIGIIGGSISGLAYGFIMSKLRPKIIKQSDQTNKSAL